MQTSQPVAFGTLLRRYRIAAGLTQEELAERAGISLRSLGDMERGVVHTPRKDTIALLAAALALSPPEGAALAEAARRLSAPATSVPGSVVPSAPPFVGRARELALLERHLQGSPAGAAPPLLVLAGEPGIGKTRLLQAATPRAVAQGWCVLEGGCQRRGGHEPYAPLLGALQRHLRTQSQTQLRRELAGCAWLVRLLPELAAVPIEPLPAWTLVPEQERRLMVAAVGRFLSNVAGSTGTLLLLDDLQWADPDALDLLTVLVRQAAEVSLRVIGAYRTTEVRPGDPLGVMLADLAHAGLCMRRALAPLATPEAAQLLDHLLATDEAVDPDLRERVIQRTGGVPFFLVSCAAALQQHEGEQREDDVPWDVAHSVQQRVGALSSAGRAVLGAAAVAGRLVPRTVLLAAAHLPQDDVLAGLEAACEARLLVEDGDQAYQFAHDVVREVVEAGLSAARRVVLHRQVAEALEAGPGQPPVAVLAYHYAHSDAQDKAVLYLERAGNQAQAQHGRLAAEGYYREAVKRLEWLGRPLEAARVREKLGTLLRTGGQYAEALAALEPAAMTLRAAGDLEAAGRVEAEIAGAHHDRGTLAEGLARLVSVLAPLAERGPSRALATLYNMQAVLCNSLGRFRDGLAATEPAERTARLVGADELVAEALYERGLALEHLGRLAEAVQVLSAARSVAEAAGDPWRLCWALFFLGGAHWRQGAFTAARQTTERALQLAKRHGFRNAVAFNTTRLGACAFDTGEWGAARRNFERAAAMNREVGPTINSIWPSLGLGRLCLAEGAEAEASEHLEECERLARVGSYHFGRQPTAQLLAERDLLAGHPEPAHARLALWLNPDVPEEEEVTSLLPLMGWALLDLGEVDEAAEVAGRAVAWARDQGRQVLLVDALRVAAMVATQQGRWEEAEGACQEGLSLARQMGYPYGEARLLQVYGEVQAQMGQRGPAADRLEAALAIFRRLGARKDVERTEHLLAALG
jgi:tetratricopeptide (TPR) repeat protein/transcriptional regulator with XRE-family HTH domain